VDGLIVVDCPPEEAGPLADALDAAQVSLIRLAAPTTDDERLKAVVKRTSGFVYYISVAGVTGVKEADAAAVAPHVARVRKASGLPVAVGFGIRTPELAASIARVADAAVVGSALVDEVAKAVEMNEDVTQRVLSKVNSLSKAVRSARVGQTTV
jgi:tryptophan synthase alpha chain